MSKKPAIEDLPYRPCVGVALFNRQGLVWVGSRSDADAEGEGKGSWWQMPQGGLDKDEDPKAAAYRELFEETSIRSVSLLREAPGWFRYDLPLELVATSWGGRYRGQKQKWFALRFEGDEFGDRRASTPVAESTSQNSPNGDGSGSNAFRT